MDELDRALLALRNGERNTARSILAGILRANPRNELAWYWLATCVDSVQQKKDCLSRVVALNPNNLQAQAALAKLEHTLSTPESKTGHALSTNPQTISKPANPSRPASIGTTARPQKTEKIGGIRWEVWIGIGTLLLLVAWALIAISGVSTVTHNTADLQASDPTQFKIAAGKYQLIEVFTTW